MAESSENLDTILRDWAKGKVHKILVEVLNRYEKQGEKYSSCLSRHWSKTKPSTKLVLVSRKPLLYLEVKKPSKQNVYEINLFEKSNFSQPRNNCYSDDKN